MSVSLTPLSATIGRDQWKLIPITHDLFRVEKNCELVAYGSVHYPSRVSIRNPDNDRLRGVTTDITQESIRLLHPRSWSEKGTITATKGRYTLHVENPKLEFTMACDNHESVVCLLTAIAFRQVAERMKWLKHFTDLLS